MNLKTFNNNKNNGSAIKILQRKIQFTEVDLALFFNAMIKYEFSGDK